MMNPEHETWIVEEGARVIEKAHFQGEASLLPIERLVRFMWEVDYCMQNAGDLANLEDMNPTLQQDAAELAAALGLRKTMAAFALSMPELEERYFDLADEMCEEILSMHRKHD